MILKLNDYISESSNINLKYMSLDWDDNILHMPTMIHMDELINEKWYPVDISTSKFAEIRTNRANWRYRNESADETFCEFRDTGPRGKNAFIDDVISSIKDKKFGPSWESFIKCLYKGMIFSIITTRGHESESIRKGVEYIIDNCLAEDQKFEMYSNCLKFSYLFGIPKGYEELSQRKHHDDYDKIPKGILSQTDLIKDYLNECIFIGVNSPLFIEKFPNLTVEESKEKALRLFIKQIHRFAQRIDAKNVSVGFSDDDIRNTEHIEKIFKGETKLNNIRNHKIKYNIYDTSKKEIKGGIRKKIEENFGYGLEQSVLPFSKWNNMTQRLYPNSMDQPNDDFHNQFKSQIGQLTDIQKDSKIKIKRSKHEKPKKIRRVHIQNKR